MHSTPTNVNNWFICQCLPVVCSSKVYQSKILYDSEGMCQACHLWALDSSSSCVKRYWLEKGWGHSCNTKSDKTLRFACWGAPDAAWDSVKTSVCYAWWCARQGEQKIIVSTLRKDHEFQWFPKGRQKIYWDYAFTPLYLCMSPQSAVSTCDFRSKGVECVPLCNDSMSDNEEEMLFQLNYKPYLKKKIADSQAW